MKKGFTLAEVLITLGIIGVVAAITMPALIANYQKQQTIVSLKKAYTVLNQAFTMAQIENGDFAEWSPDDGRTYLFSTLRGSQCADMDTAYAQALMAAEGTPTNLFNNSSCFQLNDGMKVFHLSSTTSENYNHAIYVLDINGKKAPNIRGRDVFSFYILYSVSSAWANGSVGATGCSFSFKKLGLYACGTDRSGCTTTNDNSCFGRIIQDGWAIKDDYPW
ncbi:MAG: type II secretion system GspH family protein [Heliobacteriaceae bacterium]|jgi:prepilin-type N-terminal cleavage/methylation domain-containing protein|nr:type II secretion system GspH family protein [Heliobacteriaceae bacterium]